MSNIAPIQGPMSIHKHSMALIWLNDLIVDLKLILAGMEPVAPITQERLREFDAIRAELNRCREEMGQHFAQDR